jgi:hypothetical protein
MKKITENALLFRVNQLNEKLAMYEAGVVPAGTKPVASQQTTATTAATQQTTAPHGRGAYVAPPPPVTDTKPVAAQQTAAPAQHQTVLQAYNANIASGMDKNAAWAAAQKSAGAPAQHTSGTGGKPVQTKPTTAAPTHAAPAQAKPDPAVLKQQQDLIAKGYPIKADGIMGPKTQAALDWQAQSDKRDAGLKATNNMDPSKPAPAAPTDPTQKAAYDAAIKNMDPNQTPAPAAAPAGAAAITPAFQSQQAPTPASTAQQSAYNSSALGQMQRSLQQQEAGQSIQTPPPEKPEGVQVFPGTVTQQTAASAAQPSGGWDQNDPDTPAMFRNPLPGEPGMHESVSFKNEDSLARIVQLAKW